LGYLPLTHELPPELQCCVRLITRDDLPGSRLWIKYGGGSPWYQAECEENPHALVISVLDAPYTSKTVTAETGANDGYTWNDKPEENGARPFYIEEPNDAQLRERLAAAGDNPVTLTLKDGTKLICSRSVPGILPAIDTGLYDRFVTFEVIVNGRPRLVHWFDIAEVATQQ
jgi:hypothetical protein